jgi:hypothetical protein
VCGVPTGKETLFGLLRHYEAPAPVRLLALPSKALLLSQPTKTPLPLADSSSFARAPPLGSSFAAFRCVPSLVPHWGMRPLDRFSFELLIKSCTAGLTWGEEGWRRMTWAKVFVLDMVADWGFDIVVSDVDVVW